MSCLVFLQILFLMKQIAILLTTLLFITTSAIQTQPPAWITNPNIDAGQVVVVDKSTAATFLPNGTSDKAKSQHYNRTSFTSIPKVILSLIGFAQYVPGSSSTPYGVHIFITSTALLTFTYNVSVYGSTIFDLHYLYLAIQNEGSTFYMDIVSQTFNSSSNLANSTATQRWEALTFPNPSGWVNTNYSNLDVQIIAFPIGYQIAAQSGRSYFSINATVFNQSHYSVNISTIANNILTLIDFSILMFNRQPIMANYSVYEDIAYFNVIGNTTYYFPPVLTATQYLYRNSLSGATHIEFNLSGVATIGFFYGVTSAMDDFFVWRIFNNRVRSCPANLSYYDPVNILCQDQCPAYYYADTLKVCLPCNNSCFSCSQTNTSACSSCSTLDNRTLINGSCICNAGYYESGTSACGICDYRCLTCNGGNSTTCLTCNSTLLRIVSNSTNECLCIGGFYENVTCLNCTSYANWCSLCSYNASVNNFTCLVCNSTVNRMVSINNKSCVCIDGYYEDASLNCLSCPLGCLSCTQNASQIICSSCDSSLNRSLSIDNSSCLCTMGFYENSSEVCVPCQYGCLSCYLSGSLVLCTNCDSSLSRVMNSTNVTCDCAGGMYEHANKSCVACINNCATCTSDVVCTSCSIGFYLHLNSTCVACSIGCINCQFNSSSSSQICLNCSSNLSFQLQSTSCVCINGTTLVNSSCITTNSSNVTNTSNTTNSSNVCGNGILEANQQCDDANIINTDGCSSSCIVEVDHTCINNNTLSNVSLCYYSRKIEFVPKLIYKVPGYNSVQIQLKVSAPNCNPINLKSYLQKTTYLALYDKTRLLLDSKRVLQTSWTSISTKSVIYDPTTNLIIIAFDYDASIDLTKKYFQFIPSSSTSTSGIKYFYASPTSQLTLQQPYNKLATTYYSQSDLSLVKNIKYFFLILVILYWIFLLLTFIRKRGAVGTECMLVLQLTYFTLIDQIRLVQSWSGFQLTGKYTYGVNPQLTATSPQMDLKALEIDSNLTNVLNITLIIEMLLFTTILIYKLNQYYQQRKRKEKIMQIEQSQENRSVSHQRPNQKPKLLDRFMTYVIDIFMSLMFLMTGIFVISVFFTNSTNLMSNLIETAIIVAMSLIFLVLYLRNKQKKAFSTISFLSIVINSSKTSLNSMVKIIINNYYIILYLFLILICVMIAVMRKVGIAVFAIIIIACVVIIIFQLKYKIYFQTLDNKRCIINNSALIILMVLHIICSILSDSLGTGFSIVLVSFIILLIVLIINVFIFIVLTRKQRNRQKQKQIHNEQMKQMDNELALANISFIGARSYNSINKSRDFTKDKDFINSLDISSSARKKLLGNAQGEEQLKLIEEKIRELKDFKKNIIQGIDSSRSQQIRDNSEANTVTLENVLGALDMTNEAHQIQAI